MAVKENVCCLWQFYFLQLFIPLVHHLIFLRITIVTTLLSTEHELFGPYGQGSCWSQFHGFQEICHSVPQNSFKDAKSPRLFSSNENMKSLRMCENFNFSTMAEDMYSSMTAINQPLTGRNRQGEEVVQISDYRAWADQ